jgi:hypothetical protein
MRGLRFAAWLVAGMSCTQGTEPSAPAGKPDLPQTEEADAAGGATGGVKADEAARDAGSRAADARVDVAVDDGGRAQLDVGGRDTAPAPDAAAVPSCKTARFCDDFEATASGKRPAAPWSVSTGGGATLAVDETRAFSGARSVHINAPAGTPSAWLQLGKPLLPTADNVLYARAMVFVTRTVSAHWNFIEGSGPKPGGGAATYANGGQNGRVMGVYYSAPHDCWDGGKVAFPTGRWVCVSWQFDGSKTAAGTSKDEMRVWHDGTQVEQVVQFGGGCTDGTKTEWAAPTFQTVKVGWQVFQSSPAVEMWLDDVAFDDKPLPCPAR